MTKVTFIQPDGAARTVEAEDGLSLMRAARDHDVPGIIAECGGCAACATCRVHVDPKWVAKLPPAEALEVSMLEDDPGELPNVRLSCQITVTAALEGMVVRLPRRQR